MIVLTATTQDQTDLVDIQRESAMLFGVAPNEHLCMEIPEYYPRHPSWFKIQALISHLPNHDCILWMDTDAIFVRKDHWLWAYGASASITAPVALCRDYNGFNCGVMIWRRCTQAFQFLWKIYDSYDRFRDHPWFEQGAFHTMAEEFAPFELPKRWNHYESELNSESVILHLPGKTYDHRVKVMTEQLKKLQCL